MESIDQLASNLPLFVLTGVRVSGLLFLAPVFGQKGIPQIHRVWMTLLLALLLLPATHPGEAVGAEGAAFIPLVARELAVGLLLGFVVLLSLSSAKYAGQMVGVHIGFGLANIVDPVTQEQGTLIDQFQGLMVLVLFLSLGGHRMLLEALAASFQLVPLGQAQLPSGIADGLVRLFCEVVVLGIQIAIPVLSAVFLTELAIGILSRGVPTLNIFTVGLPLRIVVGVLVLAATLPVFVGLMKRVIIGIPADLQGLLLQFAP